ncbi:MAG: class I SAM-dependent methyltransferase [Actinomycetota bacterium]|nr:class I SAM-dependent methyltransferase [Actinomycetota bacterium]
MDTAQTSPPAAAGVRTELRGELGRYYDGDRPDLAALVPRDARTVLDVGCGTGSLGAALKRFLGAEVAGIELFPEAAAQAERRLDHFIQADLDRLEALPFPAGHFDVAIFGDVLEHLRDPERLLRVVRRYLSPEGRIICSVPNIKHWSVLLPLLVNDAFAYTDAGLLDRTHVHFFTLEELGSMLTRAGFEPKHLDAHRIPMPDAALVLADAAEALGAERAETLGRLEAYQYLVVAMPVPQSD